VSNSNYPTHRKKRKDLRPRLSFWPTGNAVAASRLLLMVTQIFPFWKVCWNWLILLAPVNNCAFCDAAPLRCQLLYTRRKNQSNVFFPPSNFLFVSCCPKFDAANDKFRCQILGIVGRNSESSPRHFPSTILSSEINPTSPEAKKYNLSCCETARITIQDYDKLHTALVRECWINRGDYPATVN
jgi:hypothetical protein